MNKLAILTAVLFTGNTAFAGEAAYVSLGPVAIAPVAPVSDWSGLYVGAQLGYASAQFFDGITDPTGDGFLSGLHLGYNYDFGSFILGAEIDYNIADMSFNGVAVNTTISDLANLKLRVGYDLGSVLIYGVAAMEYATFEEFGFTYDEFGYAVGLGAEYRVAANWSFGAEYLYHKIDAIVPSNVGFQMHAIQARASYHF